MHTPSRWASLTLLVPLVATAATRSVDDDGTQCPAAAFSTIQAAIDASSPGDTVRVCAGDYPERVHVDRTLRLHGPQLGNDARLRTLGGPGEAVVRSPNPFSIGADDVVVDGFSIVVELDDEGEGRGIGLAGAGHRIVNNLFEDSSVSGIIVHRATGERPSVIRRNHFRGRWGVVADSESLAHAVTVADNLFVNASIQFVRGGHSGIRILRNVMRYDPAATTACLTQPQHQCRPVISLNDTVDVEVGQNRITGSGAVALSLVASTGLTVQGNRLRNGRGVGIRIEGAGAMDVLGNDVAGFAGAGIRVHQTTAAAIEGNAITRSRSGIVVTGSRTGYIAANRALDNREYGIDVRASPGNTFDYNEARGSGVLDCRDATTGSGTLGTANTWLDNVGDSSSPVGICRQP